MSTPTGDSENPLTTPGDATTTELVRTTLAPVRDDRPIGMFDSGFGGLTVARAMIDLLPHEDLVYVGDTARYPYGPRDLAEVRDFSLEIARHLVEDQNVKLLVVACNTASAAALSTLQQQLPVPVVGVIEPGARSLTVATRSSRVGVIGTVGTIDSGAYEDAIAATGVAVDVTALACPGFVEFVERGVTNTPQVQILAERLLAPMVDANIDTLLLGCTHYPYLARTISDVMGRDVVLVSSADETAFAVYKMLGGVRYAPPREAPGRHRFYSSGDVAWFEDLGRRLLGPELSEAESVSFVAA
jgi:glutamate racemase